MSFVFNNDLLAIFNAPDQTETQRLLHSALQVWLKKHPKLAEWAETSLPEELTVVDFPAAHCVRLRTTHGFERINRALHRCTRVASLFPNPDSCLRLISAMLAEPDDEWMTERSIPTATCNTKAMIVATEIYIKRVRQSPNSTHSNNISSDSDIFQQTFTYL